MLSNFFRIILVCTILFFYNAFANTQSTKTYTVGYGVVEGFIDSEYEGVGVELLDEIIKRVQKRGHKIEKRFQPFKRIINTFIKNNMDVCFPIINGGTYEKSGYKKWGFKKMPAHSIPMFTSGSFVIYSKKNRMKHDSLETLKGKNIGVIRGAYIPAKLKKSKEFAIVELNKGVQGFEMLNRDRLDGFLVHKFWAQGILEQNTFKNIHHGKEFETIIGSFIFHQNQDGLNLLAEFNYVIGSMILDGTYKKILAKYPNNKMVIKYP